MASEIKANKISPATGTDFTLGDSGDTFTIPSGATLTNSGTASGFGKVLQVVQTFKDDTFSTNAVGVGNAVTLTGLTASITPSSTSSKILISWMINHSTSASYTGYCNIMRDTTAIAQPSSGSNASSFNLQNRSTDVVKPASGNYLDSPSSTSAITYSFDVWSSHTANTILINQMTASAAVTTVSTITLLEIGA